MGRFSCVFVALLLAGCGSSTAPTPAQLPAANIVAVDGQLQLMSCAGNDCTFQLGLKNNGPGCAGPDLAGTVTVTLTTGAVTSAKWVLTAGSRQSIFKPGETKQAQEDTGERLRIPGGGNGSAAIAVTKQTNVACQ